MPTTPTYPGVYIEEVPSGVRTITGVATSIAAFVDYFSRGPMNRAVQLFNMGDFQREFGGLDSQSEASYAIQQFFLNGGTEAWVVRVASDNPSTLERKEPAEARVEIGATIPDVTIPAATTDGREGELTVTAISAGEWGNNLRVRVDNLPEDRRFNLIFSDFAAVDGGYTLVDQEVFRNLSMGSGDKRFVATVVNDPETGSKLVRVKARSEPPPLATPLANGTLSGLHHKEGPTIPASPKVKVVIGKTPAKTVSLKLEDGSNSGARVPLATIAPALQSGLRASLPDEPAFAGATVEVVGDRLRVLAGSANLHDRIVFKNIESSPLADHLKLTTDGASARKATLSGGHDSEGPMIPAASPVNVRIGEGDFVTTALDFSDLQGQGVTLPGPVPLNDIKRKLQAAIRSAGPAFVEVEVHAFENDLLVLSPVNAASDSVDFENTVADAPTADNLKLTAGGTDRATNGASIRRATLSGVHDQDVEVGASNPRIGIKIGTRGASQTGIIDIEAGSVSLDDLAPRLQEAIRDASQAFSDIEVRVVEDRLAVLSAGGAPNPVKFNDPPGETTTATLLKLNDADVTIRRATLSAEHDSEGPMIPAAPPVNVQIGGDNPVTAVMNIQNTALPRQMKLADIQANLQAAIQVAGTDDAYSKAIVAVVRGNRLLVVSGEGTTPSVQRGSRQNDNNTVEFTNTVASGAADALKLTGASNMRVVLSGTHPATSEPVIPDDPEVEVTIGGSTATAAPDFSDLDPSPPNVLLAQIALRLQAAIRRERPTDTPFRGTTVDVVEGSNRLLVLPGGTSDVEIEFKKPNTNTTAGDLRLIDGTTAYPATVNLQEYTLGEGAIGGTAQVGGAGGGTGMPPDADALFAGIDALEGVDLFNLLCIPRVADLAADPATKEQARTVISVAQKYCERRRAFFLMDTPKNIDDPQEIKDWVAGIQRHRNAALFYPRVKIPDPLDSFRLRSVGASGTMAGLFARIDGSRGVWKAPAGTEATLVNVSTLDDVLTDQENGALNQLAINSLRNFPIYGNVSWGARTLEGSDQLASEWKYIPVRRLALLLEESLYRGTQWAVFEPNDEPLWGQIRLNVGAFMQNLFRQGAFQGTSPREAYFVKCDKETTTQNDINLGIVNIHIGFAPLKPAEFVIIKFQQMAGQIGT